MKKATFMQSILINFIHMKIKCAILYIIIIALFLNLTACFGVSQSEFNTIYEEISAIRSERQQLSYDLAVLQNKFDQHKSKLTEYSRIAEVDFPALRSKVDEPHVLLRNSSNPGADFAVLRSGADEARVLTEILIIILEIASGDFSNTFILLEKIQGIEDATLRDDLKQKIENIHNITPEEATDVLGRILKKIESLLR